MFLKEGISLEIILKSNTKEKRKYQKFSEYFRFKYRI
jgi:hypothetical protein